MSLVVQNQVDFSSTFIKGMNSLKHHGVIKFDYYTIQPAYFGGSEIMITDELVALVKKLTEVFSSKLDVLMIGDSSEISTDYYLYIKDNHFSESTFEKTVGMKPLYSSLLSLEDSWKKLGLEISTFNVSETKDCCVLISFNNRARTM